MEALTRPVETLEPRLDSTLRIKNFYWTGPVFRPPIDPGKGRGWLAALGAARGQFALIHSEGGQITLVRDPLGINKLFFAIHASGRVATANYLWDLVKLGVPCASIYSVPAGCLLQVDPQRGSLALSRYFASTRVRAGSSRPVGEVARAMRRHLDVWFARLADQFRGRQVFVCLSGGLDSGLVAALARSHFPNLTAYTYSYTAEGDAESEDAASARRVAEALAIPFRLVPASADDVLGVVRDALVHGQDWRDFNVHCAIVNELLARAMERDLARTRERAKALVLTGDLSNEFFCDYVPVVYRGREYYSLPKTDMESLRRALIRGLDAGDREIGVFGRHGLDVIQPYGLLVDFFLELPAAFLRAPHAKQTLGRAVAGDLLPDWIFSRPKIRAQIGDSQCVRGILPTLVEHGHDSAWLRDTFRNALGIDDDGFFNRFIRAGVYRSLHGFPGRVGKGDYLIG